MWSLVASLASSASGILMILGAVAGLVGLGAFEQHKIDESKLLKLEATYKAAQAKAAADSAARQQEIDAAALSAASAEAQAQAKRAASLQTELTNAQRHISVKTITASCVPYGFLRVLYAGSHGVSTDSLTLPPGKSDGTCSPVGWAELAAALLHDYGQANANAGQLDALTALLRKQQATLTEKK